jgi:hypothetical protein
MNLRRGAPLCLVGWLAAALLLAPPLTREADAQGEPPRWLSATVLGRGVTLHWLPPAVVLPGFTGI